MRNSIRFPPFVLRYSFGAGSTKSIATLFIVGMKKGANMVVAPAAASMGAKALRPTSTFMYARVQIVLKVWLTFFNTDIN